MSEAISGGILQWTKTKLRAHAKEIRAAGAAKKTKAVFSAIPSRIKRREAARVYRRWCKTELCCLPSAEKLREAKRIKRGRG